MDNTTQIKQQPAIIADFCQQLHFVSAYKADNNSKLQQGKMALTELPYNAIKNKTYRGMNIILLWSAMKENNFDSYEWATFKQWSNWGETIRKGEKGTVIIHYAMNDEDVDGKVKTVALLKLFRVFNRAPLQSSAAE